MSGKAEGSGEDNGRLGTELKFYVAHKAEWLKMHSGEFVVVKEKNVLGFYREWEQAFRAGVAAFGLREDFLVKQVLAREPVYFVFFISAKLFVAEGSPEMPAGHGSVGPPLLGKLFNVLVRTIHFCYGAF
jgi:hypothetical protein